MFIKEVQITNLYEYTSKLGKKFKAPRTRLMYELKCDIEECGAIFLKRANICKKYGKHFCSTCVSKYGNALFCELGREGIKAKSLEKIGEVREGSRGYPEIYVGYDYPFLSIERKAAKAYWIFEHIYVMQQHLQAEIPKGYVVHHIDGNKYNNRLDNLILCTEEQHNRCHSQANGLLFVLFELGFIGFDKDKIEYFIREEKQCHQDQNARAV